MLVINFINTRNYAEQRVYELLSEKIKLFGNLFDFTDKVLGTEQLTDDGYEVREVALGGIGTGLDFERKILSIYRKCRTEVQIERAFQQLQLDFQDMIKEKVEDAQRKVIQHFDEEVRQKLRVRQQSLKDSLSRFDSQLKRYLLLSLGSQIVQKSETVFEHNGRTYYIGALLESDKDKGYRAARVSEDFINEKIQEDKKGEGRVWEVKLKHPAERGHQTFADLVGKEGQLTIDLLTCVRHTVNDSEEKFEKIIVTGLVKNGDRWEQVPSARLDKLFDLDVERELPADGRMRDELEDVAVVVLKKNQDEIGAKNEHYIYEEMDHLTQFVQESLLKFQQEMEVREHEIKELQKTMRASRTMGSHEREQIQGEIDKKQRICSRPRSAIFKRRRSNSPTRIKKYLRCAISCK